MTEIALEVLSAFTLSALAAGAVLLYARKAGIVDIPNQRSSHRVPTPRGGGIAMVTSVIGVGLYVAQRSDEVPKGSLAIVVLSLIALTLVGWRDDRGSLPVSLRLPVHLACGVAVCILVNTVAPSSGPLNLVWLAWWIMWTTASINIVNFMDGIDGIVAFQGIVYGIFLFALLPTEYFGARFGLILAAACLGFLVWNWAPAKIFMGDVGSGPLGLFFSVGGALALRGAPAVLAFLPLFPLFLDALLTLVIRYRRGERLMEAHRSHLYQRLANNAFGHAAVSAWFALAAAIGALVALSVKDASPVRMTSAICLYVVAVTAAWKVGDLQLEHRSTKAPDDKSKDLVSPLR